MTSPRCIRPGTTWFITRRTTRRHFLLRPDADQTLQRIYWYVTAVMAERFGIELHAVQVLSTHMHEVLTDTRGELPRFLQQRNRLFANAIKCHRGWPEEVFARGSANCVALYGGDAILKQTGYTLANCVAAGLTSRHEDWPGVSRVADGSPARLSVRRPDVYFDPENDQWPETASIELTVPATLARSHGGIGSAQQAIRQAIVQAVRAARATASRGRTLASEVAALCNVPFWRRASSRELFGSRAPRFSAAGCKDQAIHAVTAIGTFIQRYRIALARWKAGLRETIFPEGTWRMRREFGVACATFPS